MNTNKQKEEVYWLRLLRLADKHGRIKPPEGKKLEKYLRERLGLSKPAIDSLLKNWQEEGKIFLFKKYFPKNPHEIQVLCFEEERKAVLLVDWENIFRNLARENRNTQAVSGLFLKLIKQITGEIARIAIIFVFLPTHLMAAWEELFWEKGFFVVNCPKTQNKKGEEIDTVDETLIKLGRELINNMPLTHLCVAAGDKDYVPLFSDAIWQGLSTVAIPGSDNSIASELIEVSDRIIRFQ